MSHANLTSSSCHCAGCYWPQAPPTTEITLTSAAQAAGAIADPQSRAVTLQTVAQAQAEAGDAATALRTMMGI